VSNWRAVIFDLDDTLYSERAYVESGMRAVARWVHGRLKLPAEETFRELKQLFDEGTRGNLFDRRLEMRGIAPDDRVPAMVEVYRRHEPDIRPFAGVRRLLETLRGRFQLGLVSDGYLEVQKRKLAALGLEECFDAIVFSDALGRDAWKPDPRPFWAVLDGLSVAAGEAVYVADNPAKDFLGARGAGLASIRVRHAEGLHAEVEPASPAHKPDMEIATLDDLRGMLTRCSLQRTR
jgi:putative hydrolase of the HAD superfamily